MDSDDLMVVGLVSIEDLLELHRWDVAEVAVQALGVVPVDPAEGRELDVFDGLPGPLASGSADELGLVVPVHGLSQGVDAPIVVNS